MTRLLYDGFVKELRDALEAVMDDMTALAFKRGMNALDEYDKRLKEIDTSIAEQCETPGEAPQED